MSFIKEFQHLKISIEDIKSATNDFGDNNCIGRGGFGKVYLGELLLSKGPIMVAVKRLDTALGQGPPEFWKEILLLFQYKHENLVSLIGFCDECGENILVYEYLPNKSLDLYLSSPKLSWNQRLHICIGSARGLQFLHDPNGTERRVLHRDIKSANILLDENWNAKISDFGLSKIGPANQQFTFLVSNAVGTIGYCDPLYMQTGVLTKESDVYSFGVVLFEVLCGRHCVQNYEDIRRFLTALVQKCYDEKSLDTIIDTSVKKEIAPGCMERFSTIAYQCLMRDHTKRPSMAKIVNELEIALQYQVEYEFEKEKKLRHDHLAFESDSDYYWDTKLPRDWELITKTFNIPQAIYTDKKKLVSYLQKGLPLGKDDKFFWINDFGKKCVLLSATRFLDCDQTIPPLWVFQHDLRFSRVAKYDYNEHYDINCQINASMLSLGTMYAANLVFKYRLEPNEGDLKHFKLMKIRWKVDEMSVSSMHVAELASDGWYKIKMWHFINYGPNSDFYIVLEELSCSEDPVQSDLLIQGIEFEPTEMVQQEEDVDDDVYWEKKLPNHYEQFIQTSEKPLHYTSKKELYFLLCAGFLGSNGLWFSLCKSTGGICSMLPGTHFLQNDKIFYDWGTLSLSESRFAKVTKYTYASFLDFECSLSSAMFSSMDYECYLVFKFKDNHLHYNDTKYISSYNLDGIHHDVLFGHFDNPVKKPVNIPTIKPKNDHGLHEHDVPNIQEIEGLKFTLEDSVHSWIGQRKDGWMEVKLCKSLPQVQEHKTLYVNFYYRKGGFHGIVVEGIEFRPKQSNINLLNKSHTFLKL